MIREKFEVKRIEEIKEADIPFLGLHRKPIKSQDKGFIPFT